MRKLALSTERMMTFMIMKGIILEKMIVLIAVTSREIWRLKIWRDDSRRLRGLLSKERWSLMSLEIGLKIWEELSSIMVILVLHLHHLLSVPTRLVESGKFLNPLVPIGATGNEADRW
jgi:hypothetical protein